MNNSINNQQNIPTDKVKRAAYNKQWRLNNKQNVFVKNVCYSCGQPAHFLVTKQLKPCCSEHHNKCPEKRRKNSVGGKKSYAAGTRISGPDRYKLLPQSTKDSMAWSRGKTMIDTPSIAKRAAKRKLNYKLGKFKLPKTGFAINDAMRWKRKTYPVIDSYGINCLLESMNEVKFTELCIKHNIKWCKPDKRFVLSNGCSYLPDIYLPDFNLYCDPKSEFWINHFKSNQLKNIETFELDFKVKVIIFWQKEYQSWEKILLSQIGAPNGTRTHT